MQKFCIREYGKIRIGNQASDYQQNTIYIPETAFRNLEAFAKTNEEKSQELGQIFKFGRDYLQVQNFVGVVETKDGTQIEILPKIYLPNDEKDAEKLKKQTRDIFLKMLKCLQDSPFLQLNEAHLHTTDFPILEVFISVFLQALEKLVQKGIRKNYVVEEANQPFLKGKLLVNQQIKHNIAHAERFYVQYDDFQENIAPNRLIKSTLQLLFKVSRKLANQAALSQNLLIFESVDYSQNLAKDFIETDKLNRQFTHYQSVIAWCKFFLKQESFTNYGGEAINFALLFPMEKIFEDFVGMKLKQKLSSLDWQISLQDSTYSLIENPRKFQLRPDIVFYHRQKVKMIMDTKWKVLDENQRNFDISQADLYQLFAYGKKYHCNVLYLIYPTNEKFTKPLVFDYGGGMMLRIYPLDLKNL
jgi:5-methylcytosine-specific restriction enzyme subunit McrC